MQYYMAVTISMSLIRLKSLFYSRPNHTMNGCLIYLLFGVQHTYKHKYVLIEIFEKRII